MRVKGGVVPQSRQNEVGQESHTEALGRNDFRDPSWLAGNRRCPERAGLAIDA